MPLPVAMATSPKYKQGSTEQPTPTSEKLYCKWLSVSIPNHKKSHEPVNSSPQLPQQFLTINYYANEAQFPHFVGVRTNYDFGSGGVSGRALLGDCERIRRSLGPPLELLLVLPPEECALKAGGDEGGSVLP